jgi:phage FluMu gp28-like protein
LPWGLMMILKKVLLPYQERFANDGRRLKIWLAARQVGKSTAVAYEAVCLAAASAGTSVLLVSASQRQSRELLEKVRFWILLLKAGVGEGLTRRESSEMVVLANGSRTISLPANPDTIRGFSGHIFLDEFAFHHDSRRIWAAVFPIVTRGFKLRITSTPNGKQNLFHRLWTSGDQEWSRHVTNIHHAIEDGLAVDPAALRAGVPDPETWAQEYECRFVDEATAFLTYELIGLVEHDAAGRPEMATDGPFYVGMDIGRRRDLTVIWVLEQVGDVFWTREVTVLKTASFAEQDRELNRVVKSYHPGRICMDQTGLGEKMVEDAQNRFGRNRVEGVLFSAPVKHELALGLRRVFESKKIRIPGESEIREDLHRIKRMVTVAGNIRYDAERTGAGHGDRFWAAALAVHATDEPTVGPEVISLPRAKVGSNHYVGF